MCASRSMILKERMRKLCSAKCNMSASSSSSQLPIAEKKKYETSLRGMKKIALVTNVTIICNWFLGFCALTWASAVLLGAYIQELSMWDYYDVSLLLFIEGLRFGLAGLVRFLGYRLWDFCRWALRSVAFFLPLGMGGFAVLSMLPPQIRHNIHLRFAGHRNSSLLLPAAPISASSPKTLSPSLRIFYVLVLSNAFVLLLGSSITGLMRLRYVRSSVKSLCMYHDKMMDSSTSWLHPAVDLAFAFQIQGSQYRKGKGASYVCENYADLICYLYMHDKGVEAAEAAIGSEDGYVREAAANIIGFWAVLDTFKEVKDKKALPLCFQRGMLSKLADIAAESYGSLGMAAARSFTLLLELVDPDLIGMVACVCARSTERDLIDILLGRAAELLHPNTYKLPSNLQKECHAHIYALRQYLLRLQGTENELIEAQRVQLVQKIKKALPQLVNQVPNGSTSGRYTEIIIQSGDNRLSNSTTSGGSYENIIKILDTRLSTLLPPHGAASPSSGEITRWFTAPPPRPSWRAPIKASFLLLFNVVFPLACLGVGFIINALL